MALTDSLKWLDPYALELEDVVSVTLLVTSSDDGQQHGPEHVFGAVRAASPAVLVIEQSSGRLARIPWSAIAVLTDAGPPPPSHPGLD